MPPFSGRHVPVFLLLLAPLVFAPGLAEATTLPQALYVRAALLGLAAAAAWTARGDAARLRFPDPALARPVLAFLLWAGLSLLWADNRCEAATAAVRFTVCGLAFFLVAQKAAPRPFDVLATLHLSGSLVAALGIAQHLWGVSWVPQVARPAATFSNKNLAVEVVVMVLPIGVVLVLASTRAVAHWLFAAGSALMALYVVYAFARSGWVAMALQGLTLIAYVVWRRRDLARLRQTQAAAFLWALLFVLVMARVGPGSNDAGDLLSGTMAGLREGGWEPADAAGDRVLDPRSRSRRSVSIRLAVWRNTLAMVRDHPLLGVGIGNHQVHYPAYASAVVQDPAIGTFDIDHVHDEYLRIAAELGLIGVALFTWLAVAAARIAARRLRLTKGREAWGVVAVVLGLLGGAVGATVGFPFDNAVPLLILVLYLGMLPGFASSQDWNMTIAARRRAIGLLLVAFAANACRSLAEARGDHYVLEMTSAARHRDWPEVIMAGERAVRTDPCRVKVLFAVGDAYLRTGRPVLAAATFERIVARYPNHLNALGNLGVSYLRAGAAERALPFFERALGIKPDDPLTHYYVSEVFASLGRSEDARAERQLSQRLAARIAPPIEKGPSGPPSAIVPNDRVRRLDPTAPEP
jgi:O-antigen ligase